MGVLLAIALIAYVVTKTVSDARIDHTYAKQGLVSPRLESRYGAAARERTARYGFVDYLGDAWSDHWQRRAAALEADRAAYVANPGERVRLRDRLARAKQVMNAVGRKLVDPVPVRQVEELVPEPVPAVAVAPVMHEPGTWTVDDRGDRVELAPTCTHGPHVACVRCTGDGSDLSERQNPQQSGQPFDIGGTVTAPTGEAVNYETTVSELEALAREQRGHLDSCQAALKSINDAKAAINNMQESYRASAAAASATLEHLAAKNLDGVTLANAGTAADAMPAGVVDAMYDQLEGMEVQAQERLAAAEVALGATEANLAHVQATYGAAHETVAGNLGGDSSFLDSGGQVGSVPANPAATSSAESVEDFGKRLAANGGELRRKLDETFPVK